MTGANRHDPTDDELLQIALRDPAAPEGRAAASRLLGRHQRRVYLWCHRFVRDHERALDLSQEVLMSAYRALASFGGRSRFSSWLFAIARNRCLNAMAPVRWTRDEGAEVDAIVSGEPSPDAGLELEQDEERLRLLLAEHLEPDEREALWLLAFERVPIEEITKVLGLDNATGARGLLQRARRKLRAAMSPEDLRRDP